jgi:hypothetical protein|tara:strand:- start:349 stop:1077 length:729 start_codon:yes stop_codon:yes gene_type:complete
MPLLRSPHSSYTVVFPNGVPGNWAAWFINRHDGFPKIRPLQVKENKIGHQGRSWVPIFRRIFAKKPARPVKPASDDDFWDTSAFPFETVIDKALEMGLGDFTKLVFRIDPNGHYLDYIYNNFDTIHTEEANITNHIVLEWTDIDAVDIIDTIMKENNKKARFKHTVTPDTDTFTDFYEGFVHFKDKFADKGISVDRIDLSKILKHDLYEYYRLCILIDSPPLKNWKELVNDYNEILMLRYHG